MHAYFTVIRRWFWLLALASLISGFAAFSLSKQSETRYVAEARLVIGPGVDAPNPDLTSLRTSGQLIGTYAELASTHLFYNQISDRLDLPISEDALRKSIDIKINANTQILTIRAEHADPDIAASIANTAAETMIALSPSSDEISGTNTREQLEAQAQRLEASIVASQARVDELQVELEETIALNRQNPLWGEIRIAQAQLDRYDSSLLLANDSVTQRSQGKQILDQLLLNTTNRISELEKEIANNRNLILQGLILEEIAKDRDRLSTLKESILEMQALVEAQPLETVVENSQATIDQLQTELRRSFDVSYRRFIYEQIVQERTRVSEAQKLDKDGQRLVLKEIGQERQRLSSIEALPLKMQQVLISQLDQERSLIATTQENLTVLYDSIQNAPTNQVKLFEPAISGVPVDVQVKLRVLMGSLAGALLSLILVLTYESFDHTIKTGEELNRVSGSPVLATIPKHAPLQGSGNDRLIVEAKPGSHAAESYRELASRLLLMMRRQDHQNSTGPLNTLLLSNLDAEETSGEITANLALTLSQANHRTILIDANLHRPEIAGLFGINKHGAGLTNYLVDSSTSLDRYLTHWTGNLSILPAGTILSNPFELLASDRMMELIEALKEQDSLVLISSASLPSYADSLILASQVDGILITAVSGFTRAGQVTQAIERLNEINIPVVGALLYHKSSTIFGPPSLLLRSALKRVQAQKPKTTDQKLDSPPAG